MRASGRQLLAPCQPSGLGALRSLQGKWFSDHGPWAPVKSVSALRGCSPNVWPNDTHTPLISEPPPRRFLGSHCIAAGLYVANASCHPQAAPSCFHIYAPASPCIPDPSKNPSPPISNCCRFLAIQHSLAAHTAN